MDIDWEELNRRIDAEVRRSVDEFRERVTALKPGISPRVLDYMVYHALKGAGFAP